MTWKIRHEGSPRSIEVPSLQAVVDGLQDGLWEPTDEVMSPQDQQWTAIENHPQLAEIAMDIEPPPPKVHDDETRLDMNPLIDVALVLLIFFILTTSYAALQKMLEMPNMNAQDSKTGAFTVSKAKVDQLAIRVTVRKENNKPVIRVEDKVVEQNSGAIVEELQKFVRDTHKTKLLLDAKDVEWETVVAVVDASKGAGVDEVLFLMDKK